MFAVRMKINWLFARFTLAIAARKPSCPVCCLAGDLGLLTKPSKMRIFTSLSCSDLNRPGKGYRKRSPIHRRKSSSTFFRSGSVSL